MYSPPIPTTSTQHSYDAIAEQCDLAYGTVWAVCKVLKEGKIPHSKNEKKVAEVLKGWGISVHDIVKKAPTNNWPKKPRAVAVAPEPQAMPVSTLSPLEEPEALVPPADPPKVVLAHNPRVINLGNLPLEVLLAEVRSRLRHTDIILRHSA